MLPTFLWTALAAFQGFFLGFDLANHDGTWLIALDVVLLVVAVVLALATHAAAVERAERKRIVHLHVPIQLDGHEIREALERLRREDGGHE